jgi:hypothetical protein
MFPIICSVSHYTILYSLLLFLGFKELIPLENLLSNAAERYFDGKFNEVKSTTDVIQRQTGLKES